MRDSSFFLIGLEVFKVKFRGRWQMWFQPHGVSWCWRKETDKQNCSMGDRDRQTWSLCFPSWIPLDPLVPTFAIVCFSETKASSIIYDSLSWASVLSNKSSYCYMLLGLTLNLEASQVLFFWFFPTDSSDIQALNTCSFSWISQSQERVWHSH